MQVVAAAAAAAAAPPAAETTPLPQAPCPHAKRKGDDRTPLPSGEDGSTPKRATVPDPTAVKLDNRFEALYLEVDNPAPPPLPPQDAA